MSKFWTEPSFQNLIMNIFSFDALMVLGIAVMAVAIFRSGRVIKKLKHQNELDRAREGKAFGHDFAHH